MSYKKIPDRIQQILKQCENEITNKMGLYGTHLLGPSLKSRVTDPKKKKILILNKTITRLKCRSSWHSWYKKQNRCLPVTKCCL